MSLGSSRGPGCPVLVPAVPTQAPGAWTEPEVKSFVLMS